MITRELINPRTIAVIGASRDKKKVGNVIFKNLLSSKAKVFPVNPQASEIYGHKCFNDVLEIPYELDLVIIVVKADFVLKVLKDSVKKTKNIILITAGFAEIGNKEIEDEIEKIINENKINLIGPNVLGIINNINDFNMSFYDGHIKKGNVGFISQSGSVGVAIADSCNGLGISYLFSIGNMLDIGFNDVLEFLEKDKNTDVICLYIESLENGKKFIEICKRIIKKKKIIVLKAGKTEKGKKAVLSHTASLASDSRIYSGVFEQLGIREVRTLSEMLELAELYEKYSFLGKKACVVGNAGGMNIQVTDCLIERGFKLPKLSEKLKNKLNEKLPKAWSQNNPIDLVGDALAERYSDCLEILDKESFFDFFIIVLTRQAMTEPEKTAYILRKLKKPVVCCFIGKNKQTLRAKYLLEKQGIMNFEDFCEMSRILSKF